ncbi:uncharacterized protein LOC117324273 [Pecten maximus]|uniref:uncharacterized protein LOC117324273 n=1 Tax=Pecten maximus TaxID=6579 RepID=UPI0014588E0F|nr:uncharacterized protein LOC117324273 [Pecten maximus]
MHVYIHHCIKAEVKLSIMLRMTPEQATEITMVAKQLFQEHSYTHRPEPTEYTMYTSNMHMSFPIVIHVNEREGVDPSTGFPPRTYYVPRHRGDLLYPHWLHNLLGRNLKFYTTLDQDTAREASMYREGQQLIQKMRSISAILSWDPKNPVGLKLIMAENHGNCRLPQRRRQKGLMADCVFLDNKSDRVAIQGKLFSMIIGMPFPGDVTRDVEDPGTKIDVGMFFRALECAPNIRVKWNISLTRKDIPTHVLDVIIEREREFDDFDDDDETLDGESDDSDMEEMEPI